MLLAMGVTAFLCVGIGVYPAPLYAILPYGASYDPYTLTHVVTQLQLLLFAMLAFCVLIRKGLYPAEIRAVNIDFDWLYRKLLPGIIGAGSKALKPQIDTAVAKTGQDFQHRAMRSLIRVYGPQGILVRTWPIGSMVLWVALLLGFYMSLYYFM
jgi:multicomponent Na+:H+ antiporter subunit D